MSVPAGLPPVTVTEAERAAIARLAEFPLVEAIFGRRSRRFPLGGQVPAGPLAFRSRHEPLPLSDVERALLLATVAGVTGWHYGITHHPGYAPAFPNYSGSAAGRTFPSAAGFHTAEFFFTDDSGTYFLSTSDAPPDLAPDGDAGPAPVDLEHRLNAVAGRVRRLSDERIWLPREQPYLEGHNTWIANYPGSLLVIPVADIAQHTLANLAFFAQNGYVVYDDVNGREIPGIRAFADRVDIDDPVPLSFVEQYSLTEATAELMTSVYNGQLLLQAMGLGGWSFDGIDRPTILGASGRDDVPGLGFHVQTDERWPLPNPTGLPGVFEAYCRPHFPDMAAAVDAYAERKFGPGGPFHPDTPGPWRDTPGVRGAAAPHDARFKELLSLQASYVDETFGKFPATVPTVWIMNYLQAQHIDLEFYDTLFKPGAYLDTHRDHGSTWHG